MKKYLLFICVLLLSINAIAQGSVEWTHDTRLELADFQSPETQIGSIEIISIHPAAAVLFSFEMTRAEFMFTKNWNSKVSATFSRSGAVIVAPDQQTAEYLVAFGQYSFDLAELYARKFRKELHDRKKTFSSAEYARPIYDDIVAQFNAEFARTGKLTDLGRKTEVLNDLHKRIRKEIESYPDYCKLCKPRKS
jgi:hypothetical protein